MRAQILDVCGELFRERGFDATSIDDIVNRCGISRQTLFNYFPGKDAVLGELGLRWLEEQAVAPRAGAERAGQGGVLAGMRSAIAAQARAIEADSDFLRLVVTRSQIFGAPQDRVSDRRRVKIDNLFDAVAGVVALGQSSGEVAEDIDPRIAAETIVSTMFMAVRLWATDHWNDDVTLEARMMRALDVIETGLRVR
ncbi:MAG: TetR family transcriptional regulator [Parasphingopyxis sp.]|uniref:TetR/AcrR family transcriptional regulator n=1 Tax=Parasphingopyxis sp. TaxID=1920299 RepID=UPI0032EADCF7